MNIYQVKDYQELHLIESITDAKEAIAKYTGRAEQDQEFITEFQETDPATAEIYRNWKVFNLEKVSYFQNRIIELSERLAQRQRGN
jgi:hypothetical protein